VPPRPRRAYERRYLRPVHLEANARSDRAVKGVVPVLAAGGTFAGLALAGLGAGILLSQHTGRPLWVFGGLMAGLALGGYGAVRLLVRSV
jgi:hypothetical protein